MKKIMTYLLSLVMMAGLLVAPVMRTSAATVKVKDMRTNVTANYTTNAKNYLYVCGTKIDMTNIPIFMRGGQYMGGVAKIFKNTGLNVGLTDAKEDGVATLTLTYGKKVLKIKDGSRNALLNNKATTLAAAPFRAYYTKCKAVRWVVPVMSVCSKLGINYTRSDAGLIKITKKTAATTTTPTKRIVLCIDAGHGGKDSGAIGNGLKEKDLTLKIVLAAKKYFDANSKFQVFYTRINDTYPSLLARSELANSKKADLFLCIHINSFSSTSHGTETMYNPSRCKETKKNGITSLSLASYMQKKTVAATGFYDRGLVERTKLSVLNHTNMPACLIEYGFITNPTEAMKIRNNTTNYGKALYAATVNYCKAKGLYK